MGDVIKGRTITTEEWEEVTAILEKYGKKVFDASDTDIPFDEAVRAEMALTGCDNAFARYIVAMQRGMLKNDSDSEYGMIY